MVETKKGILTYPLLKHLIILYMYGIYLGDELLNTGSQEFCEMLKKKWENDNLEIRQL